MHAPACNQPENRHKINPGKPWANFAYRSSVTKNPISIRPTAKQLSGWFVDSGRIPMYLSLDHDEGYARLPPDKKLIDSY